MRGLYWIIPVAISIAGLPLVCESSSSGNDYWLLYQETLEGDEKDKNDCERKPYEKKCDSLFKYKYNGYYVFEENDELGIEGKYQKAVKNITTGKPVVNRNDDTHVVVMSLRTDTLECTKNDEIFKQVDAAVVSSTTIDGKAPALSNQKTPTEIPKKVPKPFVCDLETRDKGNTKITYTVNKPGNIESSQPPSSPPAKTENPEQKTKPLLQGQIRVHELYRFRIIAGPVFSSLSAKNRSYSTITNTGGQTVISSSKNNDLPVSLPVFLKVYLAPEGRDILEKPKFLERFSAIVGLNLVDNPLKNFYLGLSLETFPGVDIVGGAHFAKITQLAGGFSDGQQIAAGATPPTSDKFLTGGFVGITADVGVIGSWLGNTIAKTIKDGFK